ncbi:MAG: polyphosphate polymerase domain-containing protein [Bacteroidetes bacterium]|nr:MAG: polyphosphate polymerase domain-containing protein [Bacteroidota bacterium]
MGVAGNTIPQPLIFYQKGKNIVSFIRSFPKSHNFRYERKFTLRAESPALPRAVIARHPAFFREIFAPRTINNIYFDTPQLDYFHDNKKGIADRKKARIRWYGDTFGHIARPQLEFKIKKGLVGDKWTFPLQPFHLKPGISHTDLENLFRNSDLPAPVLEALLYLRPTLLNTYRRTYFRSANQHFRLTLDEDLTFFRTGSFHNTFSEKQTLPNHFVLELKYETAFDDTADAIAGALPVRLDKSSKYVTGVEMFL